MKKSINTLWTCATVAIALMTSSSSVAQQLPQLSLFPENAYVLNPAIAGSNPWFEVKGMNRTQWTGITDAPRTFTLSLQGPLRNPHMGVGGYLFTDNAGPTRRTGIQLSYAYHVFLNDKVKLGLGLSGGVLQFAIDCSKIKLAQDGDPALLGQLQSQTVFDATFGAHLYGENWFVGFSLPQLLQNEISVFDSQNQELNKLEDHYYIMAGYKYAVNDDIKLEPSVLIKYVSPVPMKWEGNLRLWYKNMVWLGGSYRSADAVVVMAGYQFKETINLAYAYDITTSGFKNYSSGTHEILVGFRFNQ